MVHLNLNSTDYILEPLKFEQDISKLKDPPGSGGLMTALYQYRRLLTLGPGGFEGGFTHGGNEPFYPPLADGSKPEEWNQLRVDCEVLLTEHGAVQTKWYFCARTRRWPASK